MYVKTCGACGKVFFTRSSSREGCCKECDRELAQIRREEEWQPCWLCKKACGGCSWSKYLKPVDGWVAEPTIVKDSTGDFPSYKIKECPEFIKG